MMSPLEKKADALTVLAPQLGEAGASDVECSYQVGGVLARCTVDGRMVQRVGDTPYSALLLLLNEVES